MREFSYLVLIVCISIMLSCQQAETINENDESSPTPINVESSSNPANDSKDDKFLVLTFEDNVLDHRFLQFLRLDKINEIKSFYEEPINFEGFAKINIVGITNEYILLQGVNDLHYRYDGDDNPEYTLLLFDRLSFPSNKPLYKATYSGYPGSAYYRIGNNFYIGSKDEVRLVTIHNNRLKAELIYNFKASIYGSPYKEIDAFTQFGDKLLAIDDVVRPFYSFLFDVKKPDKPKFLRKLDLPMGVNNHYVNAISDETYIYTLCSYGHRGGSGNTIYAFKYKNEQLYIDYVYEGSHARNYFHSDDYDPTNFGGHFFPDIREINQLGDKILLTGMNGIIELNKKPKILNEESHKSVSIIDYNKREFLRDGINIDPALSEAKVHEFEGVIVSLAVVKDTVYAVHKIYDEKPELSVYKHNNKSIPERTELLVLKYDETNQKFITINSIKIDDWVTKIYFNK